MRGRSTLSGWALLWAVGFGTPSTFAGVSECVNACLESAAADFESCRALGGTPEECSARAEQSFRECAGRAGCQGACESECLAETTTALAGCLDGGASGEECAALTKDVAGDCYASCSTGCELDCLITAALECLAGGGSAGECTAFARQELETCAGDCADLNDKDEDGIPDGLDRCTFNPDPTCGTAHAGGPYIVSPATGIALDGGASLIPGGEIVDYSWDLNGDGRFGDATGVRPALSVAQFLGIQRTAIGLRVTDDRGLSATGYAEFELAERSFVAEDIAVPEGDEGRREVAVVVRLSQPVRHAVTVEYLTGDGAPVAGTLGKPFTWDNCGIFRILDLYERGRLVHADGTPPHEEDFPAWPHPQGFYDIECRFYHWHSPEIDSLKGCGHGFVYEPERHPHPATAGEDYLPASGTITFEPGETERDIVVEIIGDTAPEEDETFQVILRNPSIGTLVDGVGVVTILADGDTETPLEDCSDAVDNDGDGLADCDDPDCDADAACPQALRAFVRCDVTGDGVLNVSDAVHMMKELFQGTPEILCREATDCNGDRARDITDVVYSLSFCFGGGAPPPPPFPACGGIEGAEVDCAVYEACEPAPGASSNDRVERPPLE